MATKIKTDNNYDNEKSNSNNINRGQPIYYKNELHYYNYLLYYFTNYFFTKN